MAPLRLRGALLQARRSEKNWPLGFGVWVDLVRTLCVPVRNGTFALSSCEFFVGRALALDRLLLQCASFLPSLAGLRSPLLSAPLRRASGDDDH
jgi:hypothetical protein